jgi:hypothetical protein
VVTVVKSINFVLVIFQNFTENLFLLLAKNAAEKLQK